MPTSSCRHPTLALVAVIAACGLTANAHAAVHAAIPDALDAPQGDYGLLSKPPAECQTLRDKIEALDEVIAEHPDVRATRDAYDASDLGRRERAAMEAMSAEHCFADAEGNISATCAALMAEIDACATAFENSPDFQRIQALPEVVEFDQLSQRFADLCASTMPMPILDDACDWSCDESDSDEAYDCDAPPDDDLPGTV